MQISDFGLAVSVGVHGSNNIKLSGTLGYVAPEYLLDGNILTFALTLFSHLGIVPNNTIILLCITYIS